MLVPAGLGHHVDHALCAAAGLRLADEGCRVAFYEDRPYACSMSDREIRQALSSLEPTLVRHPASGVMGTGKHRRLFYPSQFDAFFREAIAADEAAARVEHLWARPDATWLNGPATPPDPEETT
jgi:hypothetical protein